MKRGRPNKNLTEYPVGINFLHDIKVQKLIRYQGAKSIAVYMCLLGNIYSEGYYMRWDDSIPSVVSSVTGCDEGYVSEVVQCCLRVNLFSQAMFLEHAVLTSRGIQQRYRDQMLLYRRIVEIKDYNVIDKEEPQLPVTIPEIVAAMHESHLWYQRLTLSLEISRDELWLYVDEWAADMDLNETKFPSAREAKKACEAWLKKNINRLTRLRIKNKKQTINNATTQPRPTDKRRASNVPAAVTEAKTGNF